MLGGETPPLRGRDLSENRKLLFNIALVDMLEKFYAVFHPRLEKLMMRV